jgi:hypothetical protein
VRRKGNEGRLTCAWSSSTDYWDEYIVSQFVGGLHRIQSWRSDASAISPKRKEMIADSVVRRSRGDGGRKGNEISTYSFVVRHFDCRCVVGE